MRLRLFCSALLVIACAAPALASTDGGTDSPFSLGAGARDLSLGGAGWAQSDFATAAFWNASRLAGAERLSIGGFHTRLFDSDVLYDYFGIAYPTLDYGTFGLGIFRLGVGGIEERDAANTLLGEISDRRLGFHFAYAKAAGNYNLGIAAALEHHRLGSYTSVSSPGVTLSASRAFHPAATWLRSIVLATNLRNAIQPGSKLTDASVKDHTAMEAATSILLQPSQSLPHTITLSGAIRKLDGVSARASLGLEYEIDSMLALRGGLRDDRAAFGAGLRFRLLQFDYAYIDRDLSALHTFSVTIDFGASRSERRLARSVQQRAEFDAIMARNLTERSQATLDRLVSSGRAALDAGDFAGAAGQFDRALFVARSSSLDTTEIATLANRARHELESVSRARRFFAHIDSAEASLQAGDYLATRYFASLALSEDPESAKALQLQSQAETALMDAAQREEEIRAQLWTADSLLNYGDFDHALKLAISLDQFAPDDPAVAIMLKRARFENWRVRSDQAFASGDWDAAQTALDSALAIMPGHQYCRSMKQRIAEARSAVEVVPADTLVEPAPLDAATRREVGEAYAAGRDAFERGDLQTAIRRWETVERLAPDYQSVREYLVNAYKYVGVELYGQDRLPEAIAVWEKAAQVAPDNREIERYILRARNEILKLKELSYGP